MLLGRQTSAWLIPRDSPQERAFVEHRRKDSELGSFVRRVQRAVRRVPVAQDGPAAKLGPLCVQRLQGPNNDVRVRIPRPMWSEAALMKPCVIAKTVQFACVATDLARGELGCSVSFQPLQRLQLNWQAMAVPTRDVAVCDVAKGIRRFEWLVQDVCTVRQATSSKYLTVRPCEIWYRSVMSLRILFSA